MIDPWYVPTSRSRRGQGVGRAAAFALTLAAQVRSMANCAIFLITGVPWLMVNQRQPACGARMIVIVRFERGATPHAPPPPIRGEGA